MPNTCEDPDPLPRIRSHTARNEPAYSVSVDSFVSAPRQPQSGHSRSIRGHQRVAIFGDRCSVVIGGGEKGVFIPRCRVEPASPQVAHGYVRIELRNAELGAMHSRQAGPGRQQKGLGRAVETLRGRLIGRQPVSIPKARPIAGAAAARSSGSLRPPVGRCSSLSALGSRTLVEVRHQAPWPIRNAGSVDQGNPSACLLAPSTRCGRRRKRQPRPQTRIAGSQSFQQIGEQGHVVAALADAELAQEPLEAFIIEPDLGCPDSER